MNKKMKSKKRDVFDDNSIKVPFVVPNITKSDKELRKNIWRISEFFFKNFYRG